MLRPQTTKASLDDPTLIQMRVTLKVLIKGCTAGLEKVRMCALGGGLSCLICLVLGAWFNMCSMHRLHGWVADVGAV